MADIRFRNQIGGEGVLSGPADVALRAECGQYQPPRYQVSLTMISPEQSMRSEIYKHNVSLSLRLESDVVELAIDAAICWLEVLFGAVSFPCPTGVGFDCEVRAIFFAGDSNGVPGACRFRERSVSAAVL